MRVINLQKLQVDGLEAIGKIPKGLTWSDPFPPSYSINLIKNKGETKTIIVCTDSFGGGVSYAIHDGNIVVSGNERVLGADEIVFIKTRHPRLLREIEALDQ
ncbi:MAG: hypothetical protein JWQ38_471 [Flavipsychrobacter sp.]|nr:hypothetical protein [Flavipsychrobacter sp.]